MASGWVRYRTGRVCPICGDDHYCALREAHISPNGKEERPWVKCMRLGPGQVPMEPGYVYERPLQKGGGYKWLLPGDLPAEGVLSPAERAAKEKDDRERELTKLNVAGSNWKQARTLGGVNHPRLFEYLGLSRGLPLDRLPGNKIPAALRFHPKCWEKGRAADGNVQLWPAMIAAMPTHLAYAPKKAMALHRTFLDVDGPGKRPTSKEHPNARLRLGAGSGCGVRLGTDYTTGVLIVGEGIETTLAAWLAAPENAAAWAMLDAPSLERLFLPENLATPGGDDSLHTIIIAADLDGWHPANDQKHLRGQRAAEKLKKRAAKEWPHITVEIRLPHVEHFPELVKAGDASQADAGGALLPIDNDAGVDWNDCIARFKWARVKNALWAGVDVAANKARSLQTAGEPPSDAAAAAKRKDPATSPASDDELKKAFGGGGDRTPPRTQRSGGDDGQKKARLPDSPLERARRYLLDREAPPLDDRPESGIYLRLWHKSHWEWDGRRYAELEDPCVFGRVQPWMSQFTTYGRDGPEPVDVSPWEVNKVIGSFPTECVVQVPAMPAWLTRTFDENGSPLWGQAAQRSSRTKPPAGFPLNLIAFDNGLLDRDAWTIGDLRVLPHTPLWFSRTCLPYAMPWEEISKALDAERAGDVGALDKLVEKYAPRWLGFLKDVSNDSAAWISCLQECFGHSLSGQRLLQKILMIVGPRRSGKGTIQGVWEQVVGVENRVATSFSDLGSEKRKNHLFGWVGMLLAIMSDAHLGRHTDSVSAVEVLKKISGNDPVPVEAKFKPEYSTRLPAFVSIFSNEMPSLQDSSDAFGGRLLILPMTKSYYGKEDLTLQDALAGESVGVMIWALIGLRRLCRAIAAGRGFTEPAESVKAREDFTRQSSPVHAFAEECLELVHGPEGADVLEWCPRMYAAWCAYCKATGKQPGSTETLSRKLHSMHAGCETVQRVMEKGGLKAKVRAYTAVRLARLPEGFVEPTWTGDAYVPPARPADGPAVDEHGDPIPF